jgi:RNA polymerase sigma-70 factor (ECF subfamily)
MAADAAIEQELRERCASGDFGAAVTQALRGYGPEIFSYLMAVTRNRADAADAHQIFSVSLWEQLPAFRWECSLRAWCYVLARGALGRMARGRTPQVPLSNHPEALAIAAQARSQTQEFLRTAVRERVNALREKLPLDDQTLLILRVNRKLAWRDIARVLAGGEDLDDKALDQKAAALRKRFERLKETLRELAGR